MKHWLKIKEKSFISDIYLKEIALNTLKDLESVKSTAELLRSVKIHFLFSVRSAGLNLITKEEGDAGPLSSI